MNDHNDIDSDVIEEDFNEYKILKTLVRKETSVESKFNKNRNIYEI